MKKIRVVFCLCLVFSGSGSGFTEAFGQHKAENPAPFRPTSYYLQVLKDRLGKEQNEPKNGPKSGKDEAKLEESVEDLINEDYENAHSRDRLEQYLPDDVVKMCMGYLDHHDPAHLALDCPAVAMKNVLDKKFLDHKNISLADKVFLTELDRQFVKIPEGLVRSKWDYDRHRWEKKPVKAFETTRYPVTRAFWKEVMGKIPSHVPDDQRESWGSCPDCPVTDVTYFEYVLDEKGNPLRDDHGRERIRPGEVKIFLQKLNERAKDTERTYDLPTLEQVQYSISADVTGDNWDNFSKGVTNKNADQYVTHKENSGGQIQPVGHKRLNEFGIELGNVYKISKDSCRWLTLEHHSVSYARFCDLSPGSYCSEVHSAAARLHTDIQIGPRLCREDAGFVLVRDCH